MNATRNVEKIKNVVIKAVIQVVLSDGVWISHNIYTTLMFRVEFSTNYATGTSLTPTKSSVLVHDLQKYISIYHNCINNINRP